MRRVRRVQMGLLVGMLVVVASGAGAVGVVVVDDGYRVLLGDQNVTFEALEDKPLVNGEPAPGEATRVDEASLEPWRGYERTWLANVTESGSVLVMGERTGVVLEAEGSKGDDGAVVQEEGEEGEESGDGIKEPPREEGDPDAGPSRDDGMDVTSAGSEGSVEVGSGEEEGVGSSGEARGSWWLVGALFAVAGGLGVLEVIQRVRRGRAVLVVPGLEGTREVVLVEVGMGVGKDA